MNPTPGASSPALPHRNPPGSAFDAMAPDYDRAFTGTIIGSLFRAAVWQRLDARFQTGDRILELGCGTGEDALYLAERGIRVAATDISAGMIQRAQEKLNLSDAGRLVTVRQLAIEDLASTPFPDLAGPFDGALSNFGGLNCVSDLGATAGALSRRLRPGAVVMLCVMAPLCPWEWIWQIRLGKPGKAFRRLRPGGVQWRGMTVRYPSVRAVSRAFAPHFRPLRASGIGALTPPPYAETWAARRPNLLARLDAWERRFEIFPALPHLCDHYLLEMEKR